MVCISCSNRKNSSGSSNNISNWMNDSVNHTLFVVLFSHKHLLLQSLHIRYRVYKYVFVALFFVSAKRKKVTHIERNTDADTLVCDLIISFNIHIVCCACERERARAWARSICAAAAFWFSSNPFRVLFAMCDVFSSSFFFCSSSLYYLFVH